MLQMTNGEKAQVWIHPGRWRSVKGGKAEFDVPEDAILEYIIHLKKFENVSFYQFIDLELEFIILELQHVAE